jgi:hypothetical protein
MQPGKPTGNEWQHSETNKHRRSAWQLTYVYIAAQEAVVVRHRLKSGLHHLTPEQVQAKIEEVRQQQFRHHVAPTSDVNANGKLWSGNVRDLMATRLHVRANSLKAKAAEDCSWQELAAYVAEQAAAVATAKLPPHVAQKLQSYLEEEAKSEADRARRSMWALRQREQKQQQQQQPRQQNNGCMPEPLPQATIQQALAFM